MNRELNQDRAPADEGVELCAFLIRVGAVLAVAVALVVCFH